MRVTGDVYIPQNHLSQEQSIKHYNQIQFHANIKINNPKTNNSVIHNPLRNKVHLDLK